MVARHCTRLLPGTTTQFRSLTQTSKNPVAIVFPGQGAQYVGMADKYLSAPGAREVFQTARSILGYDLLKLCQKGPEKVLKLTYYCQPAVMATSLAALHWLKKEDPSVFERCVATAGFSVGELTSLAFSEAVSLEDAFSIVKVRAKAMHDASTDVNSGMINVRGLEIPKIEEMCLEAEDICKREGVEGVAVIGNYLFPNAVSVSGSDYALSLVSDLATQSGGKAKRLKVAGAFHSPLMAGASVALRRVLVGVPIADPLIPVYSNVTGYQHSQSTELTELFCQQLQMSVRWQSLIENMIDEHGKDLEFYEVGPSRQISAMIAQIHRPSRRRTKATDSGPKL
ncbi:malonyl-CoA-acyl carrier protein transacylase, mitochondrial-like [Bolinopsis microptera]|uniref:malonyl-CoA-acyl carrier protein transacylase, mitochondrial-like n=1 Tax=Bolinopsis microptera TaxID=2820187 RepID=UPI003078BD38